jgi:arabinogalactan endo-1,4-beta-galactosidase
MKRTSPFGLHLGTVLLTLCTVVSGALAASPPPPPFACGVDASWLPQMEKCGYLFYNGSGVQENCFQILKDLGVNAIRLRVWVNPSTDTANGCCNKAQTVTTAMQAAAMGFRIMIDFHYSDVWADPGHQTKPATWTNDTGVALCDSVAAFTTSVLTALVDSGVMPEWVQVGNETNNGMLWPTGECSGTGTGGFKNFSRLIDSGYAAVKAVDTSIKVVIHISNGYDNSLFEWMFDSLTKYNTRYDVIGMSHYPTIVGGSTWKKQDSLCYVNMQDMIKQFGKQVMIPEVGDTAARGPQTDSMLTDMIAKVKSVNGLGIFYWEPECYSWNGYKMGAWNTNGKPTVALNAYAAATMVHPVRSVAGACPPAGELTLSTSNDRIVIPAVLAGGPAVLSLYDLSGALVRKAVFARAPASLLLSKEFGVSHGTIVAKIQAIAP